MEVPLQEKKKIRKWLWPILVYKALVSLHFLDYYNFLWLNFILIYIRKFASMSCKIIQYFIIFPFIQLQNQELHLCL